MTKIEDLYGAVIEGAVQRIRPKIMTVCANNLWAPSHHVVAGISSRADVMKRIATPMIGGVITSAILELLIYPVVYAIWRKRSLPPESPVGSPLTAEVAIDSTMRGSSRADFHQGSDGLLRGRQPH